MPFSFQKSTEPSAAYTAPVQGEQFTAVVRPFAVDRLQTMLSWMRQMTPAAYAVDAIDTTFRAVLLPAASSFDGRVASFARSAQMAMVSVYAVSSEGTQYRAALDPFFVKLSQPSRVEMPPALYALAAEGTVFRARVALDALGESFSAGMQTLRQQFSRAGDGKAFPGYYVPSGKIIVAADGQSALLSEALRSGAGWFLDTETNELVIDTTKPGSLWIEFLKEPGVAITIELPDIWDQ